MGQAMPRAHPAILVVEDETLLRLTAVDLLRDDGFVVFEAENADQALELLEAHREIGIVFTDIQMAGSMNGVELTRVIRRRWPPIQFIIVSGRAVPSQDDLPSGAVFFAKPYDFDRVAGTIRQLAAAGPR